jgi:hypothetical protein
VGIGITDPSSLTHLFRNSPYASRATNPLVSGSGAPQLTLGAGTARLYCGIYYTSGAGSGVAATIQSSDYYNSLDHGTALLLNPLGGFVGIGTTNPQYALDVNGVVRGTNFITATGSVGIGTTNPQWPLHIRSSVYAGGEISGYTLQKSGVLGPTSSDPWKDAYGIVVESVNGFDRESGVKAGVFFASATLMPSDIRIKNEMYEISDGEALANLRKIEPTRYKYIDNIGRTNTEVFGFIAQQVREHFPHAVRFISEFIPNIFDLKPITYITDASGTAYSTIQDISDGLVAKCIQGQRIRLYDDNNIKYDIPIYSIDSSNSLTVRMPQGMTVFNPGSDAENRIFVFGIEVDDFHALNKDYLFTVNFAATQEIDRTVVSQAERIRVLEEKVTTQAERIRVLEQTVAEEVASNVAQQSTIDTIILQLAQVKQFINMP